MPYSDKEKQKEANRKYSKNHYKNNKEYYKQRNIKRRKDLKHWFYETYLKNESCKECGETHQACFDFHHNDPSEKDGSVFKMVHNGFSKEKIIKEVNKCTILCANCHRKLHYSKFKGV